MLTDNHTEYAYPSNFRVVYMSFEENKKIIQSRFDFPIVLDCPYKLCDFKPAYGYIYEDYIAGYSHWGHCDVDLLMGNLSRYLTDELLLSYDKLFCLGHMTIYRNTFENNRVFMNSLNNKAIYKDVYSSNQSFCFDEVWRDDNNIHTLFQQANKSILSEDFSLNIDFGTTKFVRVKYVGKNVPNNGHGYVYENYQRYIYTWNNGKIVRYVKTDGRIIGEEYMYIHLQKRKMNWEPKCLNAPIVKIVPNSFMPLEVFDVTMENFGKIRTWAFNDHYWRIHIVGKWKRLKKKMGL